MPTPRPRLSRVPVDAARVAQAGQFVKNLNDSSDAGLFNRQFAADIMWGNPSGGVLVGFDTLHAIHARFLDGPMRDKRSRFSLENLAFITDDVAVAQVRREPIDESGLAVDPKSLSDPYVFHEMAMYVLVWRDGEVWLAAGQNTPIRDNPLTPSQDAAPGEVLIDGPR